MRHLVLLALLAAGAAACQDAAAPRDDGQIPLAPSAPTQSSRPDLREERASLIAAGNQVSTAMARKGVVSGLDGEARRKRAVPRAPHRHAPWQAGRPRLALDQSHRALGDPVGGPRGRRVERRDPGLHLDRRPYHHRSRHRAGRAARFFLIYWRRGPGGDWRIAAFVFNLGGPQTGPLPPGFGTPTTRHRRGFHQVSSDKLLEIDAAFSAASVKQVPGLRSSASPPRTRWPSAADSSSSARRRSARPSRPGPDDVVSWVPRFAGIAESGDLGFTIGDATFELVERGDLLHQVPDRVAEAGRRPVEVRGGLRQLPSGALSRRLS